MDDLEVIENTIGWIDWIRAGALLLIGLVVARVLSQVAFRAVLAPMGRHTAATLRRLILYGLGAIVLMAAMRELGFSLSVLLGAAGILSVALGFASQTSASNLISGVFLVAEKSFVVGDVIKVGNTTGEVLSIDLLSVKLRTFDNLYVRVPNESLVKSEITTVTRFPIRRFDMQVSIAYKENIERVHNLLLKIADALDLCLDQPAPLVIFQGFGDSSINLQLSVWATRENFLTLRNSIPQRVKKAFEEAGIEIPFPHRTLFVHEATDSRPPNPTSELLP